MEYPFHVLADPDGGYVVVHPDLPGCMTQFDDLADLPWMVTESRELWIESEYESGHDIPLPSYPESHSGRFVARLPGSLHRTLAEQAERDGVSLNQHVVALLGAGVATHEVMDRLDRLSETVGAMSARLDVGDRSPAPIGDLQPVETRRTA